MRAIINGRKYDTDTAKRIGHCSNNLGHGDFRYFSETLFLKKTGEFFLAGEGGGLTQYCQPCGNGWTGGSKIIPLSVSEAKEWAEENLSVPDYEAIFGEVEE